MLPVVLYVGDRPLTTRIERRARCDHSSAARKGRQRGQVRAGCRRKDACGCRWFRSVFIFIPNKLSHAIVHRLLRLHPRNEVGNLIAA